MESPSSSVAGASFSNGKVDLSVSLNSCNGGLLKDIYFTGDKLSTTVLLNVKMPISCLRVVFKCVGVAKLGNLTKRVFHEERTLLGSDGPKEVKLQRKSYRLPVELDLPEGILPSVVCKSNYVKYYCMAKIVCKWPRKTLRTTPQEFTVYQDNSNYKNEISSYQEPSEEQNYYKDLSISYQLMKSGFFIGEAPTIVGEIYNSGKSPAKIKVGIDVHQTTKVNGDLQLIITQLKKTDEKLSEQFGSWSDNLTIAPRTTETFSAEMALKAMPPTTNCQKIDITYKVVLKVLIEKNFSFLKPKKLCYEHPIVIARHPDGRAPMCRSVSRVSIGRKSLKRQNTESTLHQEATASPALPHSQSFPSTTAVSRVTTRYNSTPPPPYYKC